jgi:Uma2 family endonuclease
MSAQIERKLFTIDDCDRMAEAGILSPEERIELINGEIVVIRPPGPRHGAAVDRTNRAFVVLVRERAIVRVQGCVVLHHMAAPLPDLALLVPRADDYADKNPSPGDVLLVVEVSDTTFEYDSTVKLPLYAITGIPEYWIADLRTNRLLVYSQPQGESYRAFREMRRGESIAPLSLPDCQIPVDLLLP